MTFKLLFLAAGLTASAVPGAPRPEHFEFTAPLTVGRGSNAPVRLILPFEVLSLSAPGGADLRILRDDGQEVPWLLRPQSEPAETAERFTFKVLAYDQQEDQAEILVERPADAGAFIAVEFDTVARDFRKQVAVEASVDRQVWRPLASDALFDYTSRIELRQTAVETPRSEARYLRIRLRDDAPPAPGGPEVKMRYDGLEFAVSGERAKAFRIDRITGLTRRGHAASYQLDRRQPTGSRFTQTDPRKNTVLTLGRLNLALAEVTLQVANPYYHRRVEVWAAEEDREEAYQLVTGGTIYRVPGMNRAENTVRLSASSYPFWRLKIINQDNPPLQVRGLEYAWVRQILYFVPEAGRSYRLYFGHPRLAAPQYELAQLLESDPVRLTVWAEATLGAVEKNPVYRPGLDVSLKEKLEKGLLGTVIIVLVGLMGFWVARLMRHT